MKNKGMVLLAGIVGAIVLTFAANSAEMKARQHLGSVVQESTYDHESKYDPTAWMRESTEWAECERTEELGPHTHSDNSQEVQEQHRQLELIKELGPPVRDDAHPPVYEEVTLIGPEVYLSGNTFLADESRPELNNSGQYDVRTDEPGKEELRKLRLQLMDQLNRILYLMQVLDQLEQLQEPQPAEPRQQLSPAEHWSRQPKDVIA